MGSLHEKITSTKEKSITLIQTVYVPIDDLTEPAPATTIAHLDATTYTIKRISCQRHLSPLAPLDSTSSILQYGIVSEKHYETVQKIKQTL